MASTPRREASRSTWTTGICWRCSTGSNWRPKTGPPNKISMGSPPGGGADRRPPIRRRSRRPGGRGLRAVLRRPRRARPRHRPGPPRGLRRCRRPRCPLAGGLRRRTGPRARSPIPGRHRQPRRVQRRGRRGVAPLRRPAVGRRRGHRRRGRRGHPRRTAATTGSPRPWPTSWARSWSPGTRDRSRTPRKASRHRSEGRATREPGSCSPARSSLASVAFDPPLPDPVAAASTAWTWATPPR